MAKDLKKALSETELLRARLCQRQRFDTAAAWAVAALPLPSPNVLI